jgi:type I site-specific restriction endonuclease
LPQPSEARTRKELIDPALKRAGWDVADANRVGLEIPVDGFDPAAWQALQVELRRVSGGQASYQVPLPAGISDYALYRPNGEIIGVVEAKRTSTDPRLAQTQAEFYVSEIANRCCADQHADHRSGLSAGGDPASLRGVRAGQTSGADRDGDRHRQDARRNVLD